MSKPSIHPTYQAAGITCGSCGTAYTMASTRGAFTVDTCASCHAFYTGKDKIADTAGRIERFHKKYGRT